MDIDPERFESLRPDANRFILGVVWLCAIGVLTVSRASILRAIRLLDEIAATVPHLTVPPFVVGFLGVLAGVVLPYCLAVIFMPVSTLAANFALRFQRKLDKVSAHTASEETVLAVATDLKTSGLEFSGLSLYLQARSPRLAKALDRRNDQLNFRMYATLPASILLGWLSFQFMAGRLLPVAAYAGSAVVGMAAFALSAYQNNKARGVLLVDIQQAALITAKTHPTLQVKP